MNANKERIDEAALALLYLGLHENNRVWKIFDWNVMNRLHEKGYISDPVNKAKSVVLTEEGLHRSKQLFHELFGDDTAPYRDRRTGFVPFPALRWRSMRATCRPAAPGPGRRCSVRR